MRKEHCINFLQIIVTATLQVVGKPNMTSWIFSNPRVPGSYKHQNFKKALLIMDDDPHWLGLLIVPSLCSFKSSGSAYMRHTESMGMFVDAGRLVHMH